jgi:hypothetical protein
VARKRTYRTIREAAEALLTQVVYVDMYGRNVGLPYKAILAELHATFPEGSKQGGGGPGKRTSVKTLRRIGYAINAQGVRLPVRRRSITILARDYARSLLLKTEDGIGIPFERISRLVKRKYPGMKSLTREQLRWLAIYVAKEFPIPSRDK